ncbi:PREDICTED: uncharacterized protein LOC109346933 [Lupinus angustifolius]|uniref:uncharacterized protein LOC109346933 n=1 Tax=Lupinus angustifolius TaxID=3871 RepID=UPI00092F013B|nr:PREDICTED: uncharacterized protein LOC109346933 [Lupinus angustifolius]
MAPENTIIPDPNDPSKPFTHIQVHNAIKLTSTNYVAWKTQLQATLLGYDLCKYVDGSFSSPPPYIIDDNGVSNTNPTTLPWFRQDRLIFSAIVGTLFHDIGALVSQTHTTEEAWNVLATTYADPSRVNARDTPITFEELHEKLINKEITASLKVIPSNFPATVNAANFMSKFLMLVALLNSKTINLLKLLVASAPRQHRPYLHKCQWCREQGYSLSHCPTFKGQFPTIQIPQTIQTRVVHKGYQPRVRAPHANVAIAMHPSSNVWLLDSGASHHVTNDLSNLSLHASYDNIKELVIGLAKDGVYEWRPPLPQAYVSVKLPTHA